MFSQLHELLPCPAAHTGSPRRQRSALRFITGNSSRLTPQCSLLSAYTLLLGLRFSGELPLHPGASPEVSSLSRLPVLCAPTRQQRQLLSAPTSPDTPRQSARAGSDPVTLPAPRAEQAADKYLSNNFLPPANKMGVSCGLGTCVIRICGCRAWCLNANTTQRGKSPRCDPHLAGPEGSSMMVTSPGKGQITGSEGKFLNSMAVVHPRLWASSGLGPSVSSLPKRTARGPSTGEGQEGT